MAEPSQTLQNPLLLQHLHLCVDQRFEYTPQQLSTERVINELVRAPQTVQNRPVQWQYLSTPPDGTLLLAWQPTNQLGHTFASDGFVWSGPEKGPLSLQDPRGFHVQVFVAESGFIPGAEQLCLHRRVRYRLVSSPNGAHDPQLELVHYTSSSPEHQSPSRSIQANAQIQKTISERKYLESQGSLTQKQFMLHDRMNYPQITVPGNTIPSNPYQQAAAQIFGGRNPMGRPQAPPGAMRPGGMGPSPHKRSQLSGRMPGGGMLPFAQPQPPPEYLKDEDNHAYGDSLDFLTPREISTARYKQHHEWMEEILSSPYSTTQIVPVGLGMSLNGELGALTEGLYDDKGILNKEAIPNLEQKVQEFLRKGEEEIEEMKRIHIEKMEEMSQQRLYADLEQKLVGQPDNDMLDQITREIEVATNKKVMPRQPIVQISKGGILDYVEEIDVQNQSSQEFVDFANMDTAGEALDFFDQGMDYTTG